MTERILNYYRKIVAPPYVEAIAAAAREFLTKALPGAAPEYLHRQPWQYLVIGLHANGAQFCTQCFKVKPHGDFARLLDFRSICESCCAANREERVKTAIANQRTKREARRFVDGYLAEIGTAEAVRRRFLDSRFGPKKRQKGGDRDPRETAL